MINLGLFFTRNIGLASWRDIGSLQREVALYQELAKEGVATTFFSYDKEDTSEIMASLPGFGNVPVQKEWLLGRKRFLRMGHYRLGLSLSKIDLIKTNQFLGGREACEAARMGKLPLIARAGYIHSMFTRWEGRPQSVVDDYMEAEKFVTSRAAAVVVTTGMMKDYVCDSYKIPSEKVRVIGNYVPAFFSSDGERRKRTDESFLVLTIGRHHAQKNYVTLMKALEGVGGVTWRSIGGGDDFDSDMEHAAARCLCSEFVKSVPSMDIPAELRATDVFVLCSDYEGHPKVLLEAMACGAACVVTRGPGVDEEVEDGVTGIVVDNEPDALREGILRLKDDPVLRENLGRAAAQKIVEKYSLEHMAISELRLYREVLGRT